MAWDQLFFALRRVAISGGCVFLPSDFPHARSTGANPHSQAQYIVVLEVVWCTSIFFSKISILILYCRVFPVNIIVWSCRITAALVTAFTISTTLMAFFMCTPVAFNWDQSIPGGHCDPGQIKSYMATGVINLVNDVAILLIPAYHLYKLQLPLLNRLALLGIFGVGWM
jgi:hypothetical protein